MQGKRKIGLRLAWTFETDFWGILSVRLGDSPCYFRAVENKSSPRRVPWVGIIYGFLILLRLYLTSRDEIIPYWADSANYASAVLNDAWFQDQRSGVAWIADAVRELGIPYKLALDGFYVALCVMASRRMARLMGEPLALVIFFLMAFASYFLRASETFISEPAMSCLLLSAALVFCRFVDRPVSQWKIGDGLLAGIVLAVAVLVRPEEMAIGCGMAAIAVFIFLAHQFYWRSGWNWRGLIFLIPLVVIWTADKVVQDHNGRVYHLAVQSRAYGPGEMALLNALYSIPPDRELRYCPVTRATIEKAAQFSPTMKALLPELVDQRNRFYVYASERYHIQGEVCTWLNFLLPDVYDSAYSANDGSADRAMMKTAHEIRAAQADGKLGRRIAYFPVDPLWRAWIPELPGIVAWGAWNSLGLHYDVRSWQGEANDRANVLPLTDERNFADGLLLRTSLNNQNQLDISGVVREAAKDSDVTSVVLRTDKGIVAASPVYPFVDMGRPARFNLVLRTAENLPEVTIEFMSGSQVLKSVTIPVPSTPTVWMNSGNESWAVVVRRDLREPAVAKRIELALLRMNDVILASGLVICIALAACRGFFGAGISLYPLVATVVPAIAFVAPRVLFYSLLHAWLRWDSLRYFSANGPSTLWALLAACALGGCWLGVALRRSSSPKRSTDH